MSTAQKQKQLLAAQQRLGTFIKENPDILEELFRFTEPEVRAVALHNLKRLDLRQVTLLCDRAKYLSRTRIIRVHREVVRCGDKVIYDEKGAHRMANKVWSMGRGRMRVYHCPYCRGYHLTHKAHKNDDRQAA